MFEWLEHDLTIPMKNFQLEICQMSEDVYKYVISFFIILNSISSSSRLFCNQASYSERFDKLNEFYSNDSYDSIKALFSPKLQLN